MVAVCVVVVVGVVDVVVVVVAVVVVSIILRAFAVDAAATRQRLVFRYPPEAGTVPACSDLRVIHQVLVPLRVVAPICWRQ